MAVLPLAQGAGEAVQIGEGLSDETIASLSRLNSLRGIARESRFPQDGVDLEALRRVLGARHSPTHADLLCMAAATCELAGDHAQTLRSVVPDIAVTMYLQSLPMSSVDLHAKRHLGIPVAG